MSFPKSVWKKGCEKHTNGSNRRKRSINLAPLFPEPTLILKIDVDTYEGLRKGVPRFLSLFDNLKIRASFFVTMGPDHSGRAILRLFRQKGFLQKMWRTKAPRLYGAKTMLYGTLLPAPFVGKGDPSLLKSIQEKTHELGIHGYDHVYWHDTLLRLSPLKAAKEWRKAVDTFCEVMGVTPSSSAAPGWQCSLNSLKVQDTLPLLYHSDTRGAHPYFPVVSSYQSRTLEIPTTLPTIDEIVDTIPDEQIQKELTQRVCSSHLSVFTAHTEVEGGVYFPFFKSWLTQLKRNGVQFVTGRECAEKLLKEKHLVPSHSFFQGRLPGRAGTVSIQGEQIKR